MLTLDDRGLIRWCGEVGTGVITYGPLAFGVLAGAVSHGATFPPGDWRGDAKDGPFADLDRSLSIVDRLRPIADRLGITLGQLALAWNVAQPGVTAAIAGSRNPEHVRENAATGDVQIDDETLAEIDQLLS